MLFKFSFAIGIPFRQVEDPTPAAVAQKLQSKHGTTITNIKRNRMKYLGNSFWGLR